MSSIAILGRSEADPNSLNRHIWIAKLGRTYLELAFETTLDKIQKATT
jgi:hypothetical protein